MDLLWVNPGLHLDALEDGANDSVSLRRRRDPSMRRHSNKGHHIDKRIGRQNVWLWVLVLVCWLGWHLNTYQNTATLCE